MVSKMRMTAAFLAVALCMTVFPVTAFAAGTETEEVVETEGAAAPETEVFTEKEETVADEGDIDEEALKELLDGSLEITVTEGGIVDGGGGKPGRFCRGRNEWLSGGDCYNQWRRSECPHWCGNGEHCLRTAAERH